MLFYPSSDPNYFKRQRSYMQDEKDTELENEDTQTGSLPDLVSADVIDTYDEIPPQDESEEPPTSIGPAPTVQPNSYIQPPPGDGSGAGAGSGAGTAGSGSGAGSGAGGAATK